MIRTFEGTNLIPQEKRREPRYPFHWRATIVLEGDRAAQPCQGTTHDISTTGCSVLTDHDISAGTLVAIRLTVPPNRTRAPVNILEIDARITYTVFAAGHRRFRSGMQFLQFRQDSQDVLLRAITQRM